MEYKNPNLVMNKTEIFTNLNFGLTWITDAEMRKHLKERYYFEECVYPNVGAMEFVLQHIADDKRDYFNKLYETTQYEYDPISNVDAHETWTETGKGKANARNNVMGDNSSKTASDTSEYPMNINQGRLLQSNVGSGSYLSNTNSVGDQETESVITHTAERKGNIGVTMTQQLIEAERKIILNMVELYCDSFKNCFMITM